MSCVQKEEKERISKFVFCRDAKLALVGTKDWIIIETQNQTLHREEEGCGHLPTYELSPGWNTDLTNQNC